MSICQSIVISPFLFKPDFYKLTPAVVLMAIGQAFFSVNVAVGAFITYSAYMPRNISIPRMAGTVAVADTAVALLVGLVIFPLVLTYGLGGRLRRDFSRTA